MPDKASLGSTLGLNDTETQILLRLVTWDRLAREQVRAIATCGHRPVKIGSVNAIVRGLRKKLAKHKIKIDAVNGFGWELPRKARERVRELLARATPSAATNGPAEPLGDSPLSFSGRTDEPRTTEIPNGRRSPRADEPQGKLGKTQETGVIFDQYHPGGVWQQLVEVLGGQEQWHDESNQQSVQRKCCSTRR